MYYCVLGFPIARWRPSTKQDAIGLKMQDGRKTRKQNKGPKLTNDLHRINRILARRVRKMGHMNGCHYDDDLDLPSAKKQRG